MKKTLGLAAAALVLGVHSHAPAEEEYARIIVVERADAPAAYAASDVQIGRRHAGSGICVVTVPRSRVPATIAALRASGAFHGVEADAVASAGAVPNDPYYTSQWHLARIQAHEAWNVTTGSAVPVAVIDSGVSPTHPDLAGRLVEGWDFISNDRATHDRLGHGTAVAGVIAGAANNGVGISGVSWSNPVMPLVVLDENNVASYSDIASAIVYAADHGARVINISLGGTDSSSALQAAVDYAWDRGCVIFAASMNNGGTQRAYPAACDHVVAVGASTSTDEIANFSNYGDWLDLVAPGEGIVTTTASGGYGAWTGTSMASPVAAGVAALMLAANLSLSANGLVNAIKSSCDDIEAPGPDAETGAGRVNAARALGAAGEPEPAGPGGEDPDTATAAPRTSSSSRCAGSAGARGSMGFVLLMLAVYFAGSSMMRTRASSSRAMSSSR